MADAVVEALQGLTRPNVLVMLFAGVLAGLVIGLIPGLGGTGAVALLLPVVYSQEPAAALALITGALAVVHTSDTISAVLLGVPGSASAAVTMLDGHALARQGQAARALSAGFLSSMTGGFVGAIGLTLSILVARPLVLSFASPELFMLCVLGITLTAFLAQGNIVKGLISGSFGVLLGAVGAAPATAEYRFTFGQLTLYDGLPLVGVALGIFGLVEIADMLARRGAVAERISVKGGWLEGARDVLHNKGLVLRGSLIGMWAGVLPAIGATAGTWMAYGQTVATAKDKKRFGKGDIRGVIGPEGANNSVEAGDLIPTLLFGIPGGVPAALLMGALLFYGIRPGPAVVTEHLDLIYTIIWSFAIANVLGAGLCFLISPALARLTYFPMATVAPALIMLMFMGAYQVHTEMIDILIMLILGLAGWVMKAAGFPRAPLLIGFVLSLPLERYFWLSYNLHGPSFATRPLVIVFIGVLVVTIAWAVISSRRQGRTTTAATERGATPEEPEPPRPWRICVGVAFLGIFLAALAYSFSLDFEARLLPVLACSAGAALSAANLTRELRIVDVAPQGISTAPLLQFAGLAVVVAIMWTFGFALALLVCVPLALRLMTRMSLVRIASYTALAFAALYGLAFYLEIAWPTGWALS